MEIHVRGKFDATELEGFDTMNVKRNTALIGMGFPEPKLIKTGTTIVGLTFKGGVIIGADSRATSGNVVADKYCTKLHKLSNKIYACGAGTAADLDQVCRLIQGNMTLLELRTRRDPMVIAAVTHAKNHLFRYMGHIGAYLIIGGVDYLGPHLFNVHAGGSVLQHSFVADGSGSLAAISTLEKEYKLDMEEKDALALLSKALTAGMQNDLNSGNTYCYMIITKDRTETKKLIVPDFCKPVEKAIDNYIADSNKSAVLMSLETKKSCDIPSSCISESMQQLKVGEALVSKPLS